MIKKNSPVKFVLELVHENQLDVRDLLLSSNNILEHKRKKIAPFNLDLEFATFPIRKLRTKFLLKHAYSPKHLSTKFYQIL